MRVCVRQFPSITSICIMSGAVAETSRAEAPASVAVVPPTGAAANRLPDPRRHAGSSPMRRGVGERVPRSLSDSDPSAAQAPDPRQGRASQARDCHRHDGGLCEANPHRRLGNAIRVEARTWVEEVGRPPRFELLLNRELVPRRVVHESRQARTAWLLDRRDAPSPKGTTVEVVACLGRTGAASRHHF